MLVDLNLDLDLKIELTETLTLTMTSFSTRIHVEITQIFENKHLPSLVPYLTFHKITQA